jgi:hypothetical protein|tara:strand:+ start:763 stop:918 length:156 start_codon:yes stop_codon:yes gene_type:complete
MPLVKPKQYETKVDFNKRCMNNAKMISEYPDRNQRFAVCQTIFKDRFRQKK